MGSVQIVWFAVLYSKFRGEGLYMNMHPFDYRTLETSLFRGACENVILIKRRQRRSG